MGSRRTLIVRRGPRRSGMFPRKRLTMTSATTLWVLAEIASSAAAAVVTIPTFQVDGKTFGMPEAVIFDDPYSGPPVVGEFVTLLPALAMLPAGNRTHDVRFDIVAREI